MRIRYETGVATLVQFATGSVLSFVSGISSVIQDCHGHSGLDCATNTLASLGLIILTVVALAILLGLGYVAQERRSSRLAIVLVCAEGFAGLIFLFDAKQATNIVDRLINLTAFAIAAWVAYVAVRLAMSRGRRIVGRARRSSFKA